MKIERVGLPEVAATKRRATDSSPGPAEKKTQAPEDSISLTPMAKEAGVRADKIAALKLEVQAGYAPDSTSVAKKLIQHAEFRGAGSTDLS
jgi:anti-sigma28 factor (negative regulator of flagellin synthesis)